MRTSHSLLIHQAWAMSCSMLEACTSSRQAVLCSSSGLASLVRLVLATHVTSMQSFYFQEFRWFVHAGLPRLFAQKKAREPVRASGRAGEA
jgi:hypothetical protein